MFQVEWRPYALNQLAAIWLQASDRDAITRATAAIDARLQRHPEAEGESREQGRRVLFEASLGVLFRIDADKPLVHVLTVWQFGRRSG